MRIKTTVKLATFLIISVVLIYSVFAVVINRTVESKYRDLSTASGIRSIFSQLRSLTTDYVLYRTERAHQQWWTVQGELLHELNTPQYQTFQRQYQLEDLDDRLNLMGEAFTKLTASLGKTGLSAPAAEANQEFQNRLITQIMLASREISTSFDKLSGNISRDVVSLQWRSTWLNVIALLILIAFIVGKSIFLSSSVVQPVLQLHEDAGIIGRGNLDYRVATDGSGEIRELALAFNKMTANLMQVTVSRDELVNEMQERQQAQEALKCQHAIMAGINRIFQEALTCETEAKLGETCLALAEELTGSRFGFICEVNQAGRFDTIAISNPGWSACKIPISEVGKLLYNVPVCGIRSKVILTGEPLLCNDPPSHPDYVLPPEGHPPITAFLGVPLKHAGQTIGMIAVGNKDGGYSAADREALEALAPTMIEAFMRKRAEEALRESETSLAEAQRIAHLGSWQWDIPQDKLSWSDEVYRIFGLEPQELHPTYQTFLSFIHPDDVPRVKHLVEESLESGKYGPFDFRIVQGDGSIRSLSARGETSFNQAGQPLRMVGIAIDITERKRAEEALRASEEKYRSLFENMNDSMAIDELLYDDQGNPKDWRILDVNSVYLSATRRSRDDIIGRRLSEIFGIDQAPEPFLSSFAHVVKTGESVRVEGYFEPLQMHMLISAFHLGGSRFATVVTDITQRKQAEEKTQRLLNTIQQERDKLNALVNSINDEVWFADTQKKFTLTNPSALREFGLSSRDEIDVEKFAESLEVYHADGSLRPSEEAPPLRALQGEVVRNLEEIIRTPASGELRYRQVSAAPVRDANGNIIGSVSVVRDITELKRAEEALRRLNEELEQRVTERTEELRLAVVQLRAEVTERQQAEQAVRESEQRLRYLASKILTTQEQERKRISMELHEGLGQSMTALKMFLRFIQKQVPTESVTVKEDFTGAQNLLKEMIEEVRRISRGLSPALLENLGLTAAVKYLLDEFGKYQNVTMQVHTDDIQNLFSPQTETSLFRIIQESLNNIAKHAQATQVSVTIKRQDGRVNFLIKDNGVGFELEHIRRNEIADKGMGLAAMDERLRMIDSHLTIVSQKSIGTESSFSIPIDAR